MNKINLLETVLFKPDLLNSNSGWIGHLPFAGWLIREIKPKIFVELGTHYGHSYFAFCQSIIESGCATKSFAVDTWKGDEHSGIYSDDIYIEVDACNQKKYSAFSTLLRTTFDNALAYFSNESIDLLHIDGLHTYEAVLHDFRSWLPKLAPGALVIFHDTNVRERNFGVWKLWEELIKEYPNNIEFIHSHGLGVLQLNNAPNKFEWLDPCFQEKKQFINFFSSLGLRQLECHEKNKLNFEIDYLKNNLFQRDMQIDSLKESLIQGEIQIDSLKNALFQNKNKIDSPLEVLTYDETQFDSLKKALTQSEAQLGVLTDTLTQRDTQLNALINSNSWRFTKPLRYSKKQYIRAKLLFKAFIFANKKLGGVKNTLIKTIQMFKREGLRGIKLRIKFLLERGHAQHYISKYPQIYFDNQIAVKNTNKEILLHTQSIDIIICIHNALDDVKLCLESVLIHTYPPYHIIIVDDGSNQQTKEYLDAFVVGQPITLIRNNESLGYTKAANIGLRASTGEFVVLLNSDTIVSSRWLDRLIQSANSSAKIGLVGPLSNTASWQSIPQIFNTEGDWANNPLPQNWSVNEYAIKVAEISNKIYPRVGFLNGFCLLIKRELINDIGLFDEEAFARGYGEENDYALRSTKNGWELCVADDCYVFHAQSKSYSHERRTELAAKATEILIKKHGQFMIDNNLSITKSHPVLQYMRMRCVDIERISFVSSELKIRFEGKRVLFLLPAGTAGGGGNIVLLEAACLRNLGVDAWICNLEIHRELFQKSHPDIQVPIVYIQSPEDLIKISSDYDAIIATLYLTVFWMVPLTNLNNCPILGYYIQDFEPDFFNKDSDEFQIAIDSYKTIENLRLFTKTNWNQKILHNSLGVSAEIVGYSFNIEKFQPTAYMRIKNDVVKIIAMVRPTTPRRAPNATMRILKRLSDHFGMKIQITIFGVNQNNLENVNYSKDFAYRNLGEIDSQSVADALSDSDIFIDCSIFQAMGLTAIEAMACGIAVIGPINGGLSEIIINKFNGILVNTEYDDDIYLAANELILDNELREKIQRNALEVVKHSPVYSSFKIMDCLFPLKN